MNRKISKARKRKPIFPHIGKPGEPGGSSVKKSPIKSFAELLQKRSPGGPPEAAGCCKPGNLLPLEQLVERIEARK